MAGFSNREWLVFTWLGVFGMFQIVQEYGVHVNREH